MKFVKYKIKFLGLNKIFGYSKESEDIISYFDTSISSLNVGDEIINDSGKKIVNNIFEKQQILISNTHNGISGKIICDVNDTNKRIVCGTNLLDSNLSRGLGCWNIGWLDALRIKPLILMGVGWSAYSRKPSLLNRLFYRTLFKNDVIHSVRDEYTKKMLMTTGVLNVINTGCPTTWEFTREFCKDIPRTKSNTVVFTLTDYSVDIENDLALIKILLKLYDHVYFWPQGSGDFEYFQSLGVSDVKIIPPKLNAYDEFLNNETDFVGTRLHGGIRALQRKRRTLIISIDNRAREKAKDINLPILERSNIKGELESLLMSDFSTDIRIDTEAINKWKSQFNNKAS